METEKYYHDFPGKKNELPEERAVLCDNKWLFDLTFKVDITSHIKAINLKLLDRNKLFQSLVCDVNTSEFKQKVFVSQLENEDLCQFPHLRYKVNVLLLVVMAARQKVIASVMI